MSDSDKPSDTGRLYDFAVAERLCPTCAIADAIRLITWYAAMPGVLSRLTRSQLEVVSAVFACSAEPRRHLHVEQLGMAAVFPTEEQP